MDCSAPMASGATQAGDNQESDRSLILFLSTDILYYIFEYIHDTSPATVSSLLFVNKRFYACAHSFPVRHQSFYFNDFVSDKRSNKSREFLRRLLEEPDVEAILKNIRSITIESNSQIQNLGNADATQLATLSVATIRKKWTLLNSLLTKISHLKEITLQGSDQPTARFLDTLQTYHPRAHLHIRNWIRIKEDEDHRNVDELALARSPNLKSIQADLGNSASSRSIQALLGNTAYSYDLRKSAFYRIVALAPNLEDVEISMGSFENESMAMIVIEDIQEEIRKNKAFREGVIPSDNAIKSLKSRGIHNVLELAKVTDLSKLETLDLGHVLYQLPREQTNNMVKIFPHLKHLSIPDIPNHPIAFFLLECDPLESLSLTELYTLEPIFSHGPTLRKLVLHQMEEIHAARYKKPLSSKELSKLREHCPILEEFTFDGPSLKCLESFSEALTEVAGFPNLHTIGIYFPLGIEDAEARMPHQFLDANEIRAEREAGRSNPVSMFENSTWLEDIWSLLRREKEKSRSCQLKELHVKIGEWERESEVRSYPSAWIIWESMNRSYAIVKPSERDDQQNDITITVRAECLSPYVTFHRTLQSSEMVE